jgi:hypothetical protein
MLSRTDIRNPDPTTQPTATSPKLVVVPPPPLGGGPLYQLLDSLIALRLGFANGTDGETELRSIGRAKVLEVRTILDTAIRNTKWVIEDVERPKPSKPSKQG